MPVRQLPSRPNLEQYKKQAKELAESFKAGDSEAMERVEQHHPCPDGFRIARFALTDAQLVIAREHGFMSWPRFAGYIETVNIQRDVVSLEDPVFAFLQAACVPMNDWHRAGTLERAEAILGEYPQAASASIYTAAVLGDDAGVRRFLAQDSKNATARGGPRGWDALTYLCFSRYLRLDHERSESFVRAARALLDAGANANTGWYEMIDHPNPRPAWEGTLYGAAGIAQHAELTRLLLERGADPNDEETPYHVPEGYDNTVLKIMLESGKLSGESLATMLLRKADWHDYNGIVYLLEHGADPNRGMHWRTTPFQHAIERDNHLKNIQAMLDHGADPALENIRYGRSAVAMAARRGRGDVLEEFERRGLPTELQGVDRLIAACANADDDAIHSIAQHEPNLVQELLAEGGTLLAEFSGNGNTEGVRRLLDLGVNPTVLYKGDGYWEVEKNSTALHVAAWRARHSTVKLLLERGVPLNALDGRGRTALALAVRACIDSYWKDSRSPESVEVLLRSGASMDGLMFPCGYEEVDALLRQYGKMAAQHGE